MDQLHPGRTSYRRKRWQTDEESWPTPTEILKLIGAGLRTTSSTGIVIESHRTLEVFKLRLSCGSTSSACPVPTSKSSQWRRGIPCPRVKYELASKCFTSQTVLTLTIPLSGIAFSEAYSVSCGFVDYPQARTPGAPLNRHYLTIYRSVTTLADGRSWWIHDIQWDSNKDIYQENALQKMELTNQNGMIYQKKSNISQIFGWKSRKWSTHGWLNGDVPLI